MTAQASSILPTGTGLTLPMPAASTVTIVMVVPPWSSSRNVTGIGEPSVARFRTLVKKRDAAAGSVGRMTRPPSTDSPAGLMTTPVSPIQPMAPSAPPRTPSTWSMASVTSSRLASSL